MKIYSDKTEDKLVNSCVTVGTFDGVHKGHRDILNVLKNIAREKDLNPAVVTFDPHPRTVVSKNNEVELLTTKEEKIELFEKTGVENLFIINFTKEFAAQTSGEFIENYIVGRFDAKHIVVGHDHKFGKDRQGDESKLREMGKEFGFGVTAVEPVFCDNEIISSTKIRKALADGDVDKAGDYLGRRYSLTGNVVEGAKRGRILGFPTANLDLKNSRKLIPQTGVYAVNCLIDSDVHKGIMNIGFRPTFEDTTELVVEVHLYNFNTDIYGKKLKVEFFKKIREEKKFSSKDELIEQIEADKKEAAKILDVDYNN